LSISGSFLIFNSIALTSTRTNVANGVVVSAATSQHRCCANVPRPPARPLTLPLSGSFNRSAWFCCSYVACTVSLSYVVYVPPPTVPTESVGQIENSCASQGELTAREPGAKRSIEAEPVVENPTFLFSVFGARSNSCLFVFTYCADSVPGVCRSSPRFSNPSSFHHLRVSSSRARFQYPLCQIRCLSRPSRNPCINNQHPN